MPLLGGGLLRVDRYAQFGSTAGEVAKNIALHPLATLTVMFGVEKLKYLFWLFIPVAFFPFFSSSAVILLVPGLLENLLTTFKSQFSGLHQYDAVLVGSLWFGVVYGIRVISVRWPRYKHVFAWGLLAAIIIGYFFRSPLNPLHFPVDLFKTRPRWEAYRAMVKSVPKEASVATQTNMVPHLAHRKHIYMLGTEPFPVEIVIIDTQNGHGFADTAAFQAYIDSYTTSLEYEAEIIKEQFVMVRKKQ